VAGVSFSLDKVPIKPESTDEIRRYISWDRNATTDPELRVKEHLGYKRRLINRRNIIVQSVSLLQVVGSSTTSKID